MKRVVSHKAGAMRILPYLCIFLALHAYGSQVVSTSPASNASNVSPGQISIVFDQIVVAASVNNNTIRMRGSVSGNLTAAFVVIPNTPVVQMFYTTAPRFGETITITVTKNVKTGMAPGVSLTESHTFQFKIFSNASFPSIGFGDPVIDQSGGSAPKAVLLAEVNGGGNLETFVANQGTDNVVMYALDADDKTFVKTTLTGATLIDPNALAAADFDNDGDMDLVVAHQDIHWIENGGGTNPVFTYNALPNGGVVFNAVATGDIDGDGDADIVTYATFFTNGIRWMENNGAADPTFTDNVINNTYSQIAGIALGDLENDGDLDIFVISEFSDQVIVFKNNGAADPTFTSSVLWTFTGGQNPRSLAINDVDNDTHLDIIVGTNGVERVLYFFNSGTASPTFTQYTVSSTINDPRGVCIADVDGSGTEDVLSASYTSGFIHWHSNTNAYPAQFLNNTMYGGAETPNAVIAGDIDGDGDVDVLSTESSPGRVRWYKTATELTFAYATPLVNSNNILQNANILLYFNGTVDATTISGNVRVNGSMQGVIPASITASSNVITINPTADFLPGEIVTVSMLSGLKRSGGTFLSNPSVIQFSVRTNAYTQLYYTSHVVNTVDSPRDVKMMDVDNDGDLDLITASYDDDRIAWHENNGGTSPTFTLRTLTTTANGALQVEGADMDNDGDLDIVASSTLDNTLAWYENNGAADPTFTERNISTSQTQIAGIAVGDINADGAMDIVRVTPTSLAWFKSDGAADPTFSINTIASSLLIATDVAVGDLDHDGDLDIVLISLGENVVRWYRNNGGTSPSFSVFTVGTGTLQPYSVNIIDLNNDGHMDVITGDVTGRLYWFLNNGATSPVFTTNSYLGPPTGIMTGCVPADVDGDLDLDVIVAANSADDLNLYKNASSTNPAFSVMTANVADIDDVWGATVGDLNGDGTLDIVTVSRQSDQIIWLKYELPRQTELKLDNGALTITDVLGGTSTDRLTLSLTGGTLKVSDPNNTIVPVGTGITEISPYEMQLPVANVQSLQINTLGGGMDTVVLNTSLTFTSGMCVVENAEYVSIAASAAISTGSGLLSIDAVAPLGIIGNLSATSGNIHLYSAGGITLTGNITTTSGQIELTAGNAISIMGNVSTVSGPIEVGASTVGQPVGLANIPVKLSSTGSVISTGTGAVGGIIIEGYAGQSSLPVGGHGFLNEGGLLRSQDADILIHGHLSSPTRLVAFNKSGAHFEVLGQGTATIMYSPVE